MKEGDKMKKTIIALRGNGNTGKSSTIKLVFDMFLKMYKEQISLIDKGPLNICDITKIFSCNKITIGIESQGDPNSKIFTSLPKFVQKKCDLIICATRTKGKTVRLVERIQLENNYDVIWVSTLYSEQKPNEVLNDRTASFIHKVISDLFDNKY